MISVIIPTYQRPKKLLEAIKSVQSQTYEQIEILIVDDNGQDDPIQQETECLVASVGDDRITYMAHPTNKGGCAARNTGIKHAKGEFVAFLDDDDVWADRFLETMLSCFTSESIGAVYCDFYSYDGLYSHTQKNPTAYSGNVRKRILEGWCPASTSLFLIRKDQIIQAGLFDENLKSFQDYDMWLRLSEYTEFFFCSEKLVVKYEGIGEQTSKNPKRRFDGYETMTRKHEAILPPKDLELFQKAKEILYYSALFNRIVYNKRHKLEYKQDKKDYINHFGSFSVRLHLFLKLNLSKKVYAKLGVLFNKSKGDIVYFKGLYPINDKEREDGKCKYLEL